MAEEIDIFAAQLSELKERSGHSYGVLAKRLHMSTSTLHRYCNGAAVPTEYAPVERFGRLCGARPEELVELHRRWIVADDARRRKAQPTRPAGADGDVASAAEDAETGESARPGSAAGPVVHDAPSDAGTSGTSGTANTSDTSEAVISGEHRSATPEPTAPETETTPESATPEAVTPDPSHSAPGPHSRPRRPRLRLRRRRSLIAAAVVAVAVPAAVVGSQAATSSRPDRTGVTAAQSRAAGEQGRPATGARSGPGSRPSPLSTPESPGASGTATPSARPSPSSPSTPPARVPAPPAGTSAPPGKRAGGTDTTAVPLALTVRPYTFIDECDQTFLSGRKPAEVPRPPVEQDARSWANALRAVPGGPMRMQVTVQGKERQAVVLQALHVRVVGRAAPLDWSAYVMADGCGSGVSPAFLDIDLDRDRPAARPVAGQQGDITIPATDFPYKASATDPQVLDIVARTSAHDVKWYLELEWSSGDRHGMLRIDDGGQPFRTSSIKQRPQYLYRADTKVWEEVEDYARR
ncbi:transcriptional regulator [Streptomyces sp. I05A-00742]|uniref:transcriptional regulator n=1 Tax=Streptomyces sp. I05A-00742 TaxID=2732853 RepID=UPI001489C406|nr:transcriptional regulator [Streptomyces sp. I05A-00742]